MTPDPFTTVDARGHRCPVPTLKLRKALEEAGPGKAVRLLATDPMAKVDIPHFCNENGYKLLTAELDDEVMVFNVIRPVSAPTRDL